MKITTLFIALLLFTGTYGQKIEGRFKKFSVSKKNESSVATFDRAWNKKPANFEGAAQISSNPPYYLVPVKGYPKEFGILYDAKDELKNIVSVTFSEDRKTMTVTYTRTVPTEKELEEFLFLAASLTRSTFLVR